MKFAPTPKYLVVRPIKIEEKVTSGGIVVPETANDDRDSTVMEGVVMAISGELEAKSSELGIHVGSTVLFARYAGLTRHTDEGPMRFLTADDVVGVVLDEE